MLDSEKEAFARKDISWEIKFRSIVAAISLSPDFYIHKLKTTRNPKTIYFGAENDTSMWVFEFSHKDDQRGVRIQTRIGFEKAFNKAIAYVDRWQPTGAVEVDCKGY